MFSAKPYVSFSPLILSAFGGIILGLATNQISGIALSPLGWFCLIPLFFALKHSGSALSFFKHSYLFSVCFLSLSLAAFVFQFVLGGILLIGIGALIFTIPFWTIFFLKNRVGYRNSLFLMPLIWPVFDWFILEHLLAVPILSVYINQAPLIWLIQYIDITGYSGISFWLVSLNVFLFILADDWLKNRKSTSFQTIPFWVKRISILLAGFFLTPLLYSFYATSTVPSSFGDTARVTVVQSAYPTLESAGDSRFRMGLDQLISTSDSVIKSESTDLIIWPESAIPVEFKEEKEISSLLMQKVLEWETPLLSGTLDLEKLSSIPDLQTYLGRDYKTYNSAVMITPQLAWMTLEQGLDITKVKLYRKQNLMHFTEYVPLSESFPVLSHLGIEIGGVKHISAGTGPTTLKFATKKESVLDVSPVVCWDLLFTTSSSNSTSNKADFIAALTNESPLGNALTTTAHEIESFTRLRSIESRRSVAKSSTTGYSFFTDPFGRVYGKLAWYETGSSTDDITLSTYNSFYNRNPHFFPLLCLGLFCLLISDMFFTGIILPKTS